ncbi:MAG TPA: ABC transporter permease [Candidatus Faecousia intestinigallinarum]|nr:ABC transporter permease [Candidatus Faecousia intestinigallinarum]
MHSIRQFLRQPLKLLAGILFMTLGVALLCVGVGQSVAARQSQAAFEEMFTTTAVMSAKYQFVDDTGEDILLREVPEDIQAWIDQFLAQHPELVKYVAQPGLASARLPELAMDNYTNYVLDYASGSIMGFAPTPQGSPYSSAVLEISVIGTKDPVVTEDGVSQEIVGTVERVLGLEAGFDDPTGRTAYLTFRAKSLAELEPLSAGERCLVYGMDYYDMEARLRAKISKRMNGGVDIGFVDPKNMHATGWAKEGSWWELDGDSQYYVANYVLGQEIWGMKWQDYRDYQAVSMTLENRGDWPADGTGLDAETFAQRYTVPTLVRLDGTAEEFLATPEGALWQRMLTEMEENAHAFPIIGVDGALNYVAEFARGQAWVAQGRAFTPEEMASGAKVCVISDILAEKNGLKLGDTITPQFYDKDPHSPYQGFVEEGEGVVYPAAYRYSPYTPDAGEETYTIIGIYTQKQPWKWVRSGEGAARYQLWIFSPNTIFVPEAAVPVEMAYGDMGFFYTLILENGAKEELEELQAWAGFEDLFLVEDQGYSVLASGLTDYQATAALTLRIGVTVYAVVLLLFLLLYPGMQGKNLATMYSLGTPEKLRMRHSLLDTLCVLLPGTLLGILAGGILWERIVDSVPAANAVTEAFRLNPWLLLGLGAAQFVLSLGAAAVLGWWMSRDKRAGRR